MIVTIIAEYNPFHNGHKFQIEKIRKFYKEAKIVVIMSGSFVQRGEAAIIDKYRRAKVALLMGADLVLELPTIFSTQNAEIFAKGSLGIISKLNPDVLSFGSEDEIEILKKIIEKIENMDQELLKKSLKEGKSYPISQEIASNLTEEEKKCFKKSNNILAMEYLKELKKLELDLEIFRVKREGTNYNDDFSVGEFASASFIRKNLEKSNLFMPKESHIELHPPFANNNLIYEYFKYLMIFDHSLDSYFDYENGMENLFLKNLEKNESEFLNSVTSKRYTKSRIKRIMLSKVLDLKKEIIIKNIGMPYLRVLASNENGFSIIRENKNEFIVNFKNADKIKNIKEIVEIEKKSSDIYSLISNNPLYMDYKNTFYKK